MLNVAGEQHVTDGIIHYLLASEQLPLYCFVGFSPKRCMCYVFSSYFTLCFLGPLGPVGPLGPAMSVCKSPSPLTATCILRLLYIPALRKLTRSLWIVCVLRVLPCSSCIHLLRKVLTMRVPDVIRFRLVPFPLIVWYKFILNYLTMNCIVNVNVCHGVILTTLFLEFISTLIIF